MGARDIKKSCTLFYGDWCLLQDTPIDAHHPLGESISVEVLEQCSRHHNLLLPFFRLIHSTEGTKGSICIVFDLIAESGLNSLML